MHITIFYKWAAVNIINKKSRMLNKRVAQYVAHMEAI